MLTRRRRPKPTPKPGLLLVWDPGPPRGPGPVLRAMHRTEEAHPVSPVAQLFFRDGAVQWGKYRCVQHTCFHPRLLRRACIRMQLHSARVSQISYPTPRALAPSQKSLRSDYLLRRTITQQSVTHLNALYPQ